MERNHTEACTDLERKREKESVYVQHKFKILTITVHLQVLVIAMTDNLKINIYFLKFLYLSSLMKSLSQYLH